MIPGSQFAPSVASGGREAAGFLSFRALPGCEPVQNGITCRIISLVIAACCRRISAVQKPRAAPAQALAALSQRLIQGLDMELPHPHEEMMSAALQGEAGIVAAFSDSNMAPPHWL